MQEKNTDSLADKSGDRSENKMHATAIDVSSSGSKQGSHFNIEVDAGFFSILTQNDFLRTGLAINLDLTLSWNDLS